MSVTATATISSGLRRQRVRSELRAEYPLRAALPMFPPLVAAAVSRLVELLALIRETRMESPGHRIERELYHISYDAYVVARNLVQQRYQWLVEYGHALLAQLPPNAPERHELAERLARTIGAAERSLVVLVTAQCALDSAIANVETQFKD